MIYIAVIFFLMPILLKIVQISSISIKIIFPTLVTYSLWFILSTGLIITEINTNYYLWFFYPFPIALIIYEFVITYRSRKHLFFTKYLLYFIIFLLILTVTNIFTHKYGWTDTTEYIKRTIIYFQNNSFLDSGMYKYNSFFYLATIFGNFRMNDFYYILSIYIYGSIFFILFIIIVSEKFVGALALPIQILLWIFISLFLNSKESTSVNWIQGVAIAIAAIVIIIEIFKNDIKWQEILFFDFLIIFCMNFSASGFAASILLIIIIKIFIFIKCKNLFQITTLLWFLSYWVFISDKLREFIYLYFLSIFLIIISFIVFLLIKKEEWKYTTYFSQWVSTLKHYNKKGPIIKFFIINIYLVTYIIVAVLLLYNQVTISIEKIIYFSISLLFFINLAMICSFYEVIFVAFILTMTSILFIFISKISFIETVPYIVSRASYGLVFLPLCFIPLMIMKISYIINKKKWSSTIKIVFINILWIPMLNPLINPTFLSFINTRFSLTFWKDAGPTKENFYFAEKHILDLSSPNNSFSEIPLPFIRESVKKGVFLYDLYHDGHLLLPNQSPKFSIFYWGTNYRQNVVDTINDMYDLAKKTTFYNSIVLIKTSELNRDYNILNNYYIVDSNKELNLWLAKY